MDRLCRKAWTCQSSNEPFSRSADEKAMDRDEEKRKLEDKLAICRRLVSEFDDGVTRSNLLDLIAELEEQIGDLDRSAACGLVAVRSNERHNPCRRFELYHQP
jgi:hypothetical protein